MGRERCGTFARVLLSDLQVNAAGPGLRRLLGVGIFLCQNQVFPDGWRAGATVIICFEFSFVGGQASSPSGGPRKRENRSGTQAYPVSVRDSAMSRALASFKYIAPAVVAGLYPLLLALELGFPLRRRKRRLAPRIVTNISISALALAVGAVISMLVSGKLSIWTEASNFGLLRALALPLVLQFVAGFLLLDLTFYYWHRLNHVFPLLWRFHNVHHIDPDLDVSTSFRFHVVEVTYSAGFRAAQMLALGVAPLTYVVYELVFQLGTMFHHSNLRLPIRLERALNRIFVTPRMHGIHHSAVREETNSNYSVVFRWWDTLHRSLQLIVPQSDLIIGVPAYQQTGDNRIRHLLSLPFRRQRPYWRSADGAEALRREGVSAPGVGTMLE